MEKYEFPSARVYLRLLKAEDIDDRYVSWFADEVVTKWLGAKGITRQDAIDFLEEGLRTKKWFNYAVCDKANDRHIGNVKVGAINRQHMISDLVTVIGERDYWGKGMRAGDQIGNRVAFDVYDIRKAMAGCTSRTGSTGAYCKAGWLSRRICPGITSSAIAWKDRVVVSRLNPKYTHKH